MACLHIRVLGSVVHSSKNPQAHQAHLCISGSVSLPLPPSTCSFFLQKVFVTLLICHKSMRFCAGFLCVCLCAFNRSQAVYTNVERSCRISRKRGVNAKAHTQTHRHLICLSWNTKEKVILCLCRCCDENDQLCLSVWSMYSMFSQCSYDFLPC